MMCIWQSVCILLMEYFLKVHNFRPRHYEYKLLFRKLNYLTLVPFYYRWRLFGPSGQYWVTVQSHVSYFACSIFTPHSHPDFTTRLHFGANLQQPNYQAACLWLGRGIRERANSTHTVLEVRIKAESLELWGSSSTLCTTCDHLHLSPIYQPLLLITVQNKLPF